MMLRCMRQKSATTGHKRWSRASCVDYRKRPFTLPERLAGIAPYRSEPPDSSSTSMSPIDGSAAEIARTSATIGTCTEYRNIGDVSRFEPRAGGLYSYTLSARTRRLCEIRTPKDSCGLRIQEQLNLRVSLNRNLSRIPPAENLIDEACRKSPAVFPRRGHS